MSDMLKNLERIKNAAGHLNKLSDEANEVIRTVEQALQATNAGLHYQSPDLAGTGRSEWLGWMRHDGKYRLMHQSSDSSEWLPLIDTRREFRIRVVKFLSNFVNMYTKHVLSHMALMEADMGRARESGGELVEALKAYCPPPKPKPRTGHVANDGMMPPPPPPPPKVSGVEDRSRARPVD